MPIEVWMRASSRPNASYEKASDSLSAGLVGKPPNQKACAFWGGAFIKGRIPMSDELAVESLGLKEIACPYVGEEPMRGFKNLSFLYRRVSITIDDMSMSYDSCDVCGFAALERGIHPHHTLLDVTIEAPVITEAIWENGCLTTGTVQGSLVVWVKSRHFSRNGAKKAALKHFPAATILADERRFLLLQIDTH